MTVGEGKEELGVVRDYYRHLSGRVFIVGGAYEVLGLDTKRSIDMRIMLSLKIQKRGEGSVITRRHRFVPKVGTKERMMEFLKRFAGGKK